MRDELDRHLSALKKQGLISAWHDRMIGPGMEWKGAIDEHLEAAELILLLVSADFLASDYCYDIEMVRALERHEAGAAVVIPVVLRAVDWSDTPIRKLQALPADEKPVASWPDRDEAFANIAAGIRKAVLKLMQAAPAPPHDALALACSAPQAGTTRIYRGREYVCIPAGSFLMGTTQARVDELRRADPTEAFSNELRQHPVSLRAFYISRHLVTNEQYQEFVSETGHPVPWRDDDWSRPFNWDRQRRTYPEGRADHPVVLVSWHDAQAYCRWLGARLPTEAEWEKAARGTGSREWPWGNAWQEGRCNTAESGLGDTTPVGHFSPRGDSPYGAADLAGNVWEWCSSFLDPYPYVADDGREAEGIGGCKALRGGAWGLDRWKARCAFRGGTHAGDLGFTIGFRIALDASDAP